MLKKQIPWLGEEIISAQEVEAAVTEMAARLDADYADKNEVVMIGVLRGAFIFLSDLVKKMETAVDLDFITTRSYGKETESSGEIEMLTEFQVDLKGKHVIVVDEIIDTGRTMMFLHEVLLGQEPASLEYCALFDKQERRHNDFNLNIKYLGKRVPNKFLVGYGLDGLDNKGRNLTGVYTLK